MPRTEKKSPEDVLRDDVAQSARLHHADFYEELRLHRNQCVENLNDSTLSDDADYHSTDGDVWRDRIALIDRIGAEEVHARFTK